VAEGLPHRVSGGLMSPRTLLKATPDAFKKLDPRVQVKNPVMFVVEIGAALCVYTAIANSSIFNRGLRQPGRGRGRGPRQGTG
jgi:high-affinity K+ transport system ATPase subunit B